MRSARFITRSLLFLLVFLMQHMLYAQETRLLRQPSKQKIDSVSVSKGVDIQLQIAVEEALKLADKEPLPKINHPEFPKPARN
jgi:hypothetical protein